MWSDFLNALTSMPVLGTVGVAAVLIFGHYVLIRGSKHLGAGRRFSRQLIMLGLTAAAAVALVWFLTAGDKSVRPQVFALLGVLISVALGLSSTTFVANAMAGLQIRVVRNFRTGDFVRVGDEFGRITEKGLFHTEIQTEDRDLVTLPNLYVVTNPVRVVRGSGTVVSASVSLGYDVARARVETLLKRAAEEAELEEPFVHITELGDFSIGYRVSGFLTEVRQLRTARSNLRKTMVDCLLGDGIEIVSPSFMNQRQLDPGKKVAPAFSSAPTPKLEDEEGVEAIIFDKADEAEEKEELSLEQERIPGEIDELRKLRQECDGEGEGIRIDGRIALLERRLKEIGERLEAPEAEDE